MSGRWRFPGMVLVWCAVSSLAGASSTGIFDPSKLERKVVRSPIPGAPPFFLYIYQGIQYRSVSPADIVETRLAQETNVCLEVRFKSLDRETGVAKLFGSDLLLLVPEAADFNLVVRGDNIWVTGTVQVRPDGKGLCLQVSNVRRLEPDIPRFQKRLELYVKKRDWGSIQEMIPQIEAACAAAIKALALGTKGQAEYERLVSESWFYALGLRADDTPRQKENAGQFYEIGSAYYEKLRHRENARYCLLLALKLDPEQQEAVRLLQRLGVKLVRHQGVWLTEREYEKLMEAERIRRDQDQQRLLAEAQERIRRLRDTVGPRLRQLQQWRASLSGQTGDRRRRLLEQMGDEVALATDERLALFLSRLIAEEADEAGALAAFRRAVASPAAQVRAEVLECAAWRATAPALDLVLEHLTNEADEGVGREAVTAIAEQRSRLALERFVAWLPRAGKGKAAVMKALKEISGKQFELEADWQSWWEQVKEEPESRVIVPE